MGEPHRGLVLLYHGTTYGWKVGVIDVVAGARFLLEHRGWITCLH